MKTLNNEKGAVAVIVVMCLIVFLGISAFVIDVGYLQYHKRNLQNTADAAALAGVAEYITGNSDIENITKVVFEYVELNGVSGDEIVSVTQSKFPNTSIEYNTVKVDLKGNRSIFFAKIFGYQNANISVTATAIAAPISGISDLIPFGIEESVFNGLNNGDYFDLYSKFDKKNNSGNWGTVNFEGSGSSVPPLTDWTTDGYQNIVKIGDTIWTAPGAGLNSNQFKTALQGRVSTEENPQFVIIPVLADGSFNGSTAVNVLGFVVIEIKSAEIQGQRIDVKAKYHKTTGIGDVDPDAKNYGFQSIRLIE